jgi:hypothetical protein
VARGCRNKSGRGAGAHWPGVTISGQGTVDRNDSLGEHGEDWNTWSRKRHVDGAGCFIEKAQSTRLTSVRVSDDDAEGNMRTRKIPGKWRRLREGDNDRKLFEGLQEARVENGKASHGEQW